MEPLPPPPLRSVLLTATASSSAARKGFTLIELLVTVAIGGLLIAAAASLVTSQIRSSTTAEIAQRVRDDASRINFLIQTEASEAVAIGQLQTSASCPNVNAATARFNLAIPRPTGSAVDATNRESVFYYVSGSNLRRCGPDINRNGSLSFGTTVDSVVSQNTALSLVTCNSVATSAREVAYQATFNDAPSGYAPPCAIARAKSFFVVDP